jgi:hypothetical protein
MRGWETLVAFGLAVALLTPTAVAAADLHLSAADRTPVRWQEWLAERGTCAVLMWASWAPGTEIDPAVVESYTRAAESVGLTLVLVAVQESFEDAHRALSGTQMTWLHDRHGTILKEYRVIEIPYLIIVDGEGTLLARLEPTPEALTGWPGTTGP